MTSSPQILTPVANAVAHYRAAASLGGTQGKPSKPDEAGFEKVAEDFEAFFAGQVFEQMFSGLEPDPITGGGQGESMFRSLMLQQYGKAIAKQHSLGIADIVKRQLIQLQEMHDQKASQ
jgi:Rod binding domain-containing protein